MTTSLAAGGGAQLAVGIALGVVVAAVAAGLWWRSHAKFVEGRREHWFKAFAAERGGTFHSGVSGAANPAPTFGVVHPTGRPLTAGGHQAWVEFRLRDRPVLGIDGHEPYRGLDDHTCFRDTHVTQVRVPPSPALRIVPGRGASVADPALAAELARWLAANPRFAQRDVVVEHGSARTWGDGCATRQNVLAEAGYLADLAENLPAAMWEHSPR
jgi:hypothetical protein